MRIHEKKIHEKIKIASRVHLEISVEIMQDIADKYSQIYINKSLDLN